MSGLIYNGIDLKVIRTVNFSKRPQMTPDGTTYLYTRYDLEVACVFNPACTSYSLPGSLAGGVQYPGDGVPNVEAGKMAGVTEASLQHILSQPRKTLIYTQTGAALLVSPLIGESCDAANGPFVEECRVQEMHGERTFLVHLRFVTYLKLCTGTDPLIAHRWKQYVEIDQDYFAQRITEGEATFRADLLVRLGQWPDQYRSQLFHSVPKGFKREQITVNVNEAGTALSYRYVDREMPLVYGDNGANSGLTRIEAYMTGSWQQTGAKTAAAQHRGALHGMAFSLMAGPTSGGGIPVLSQIVSTGMTIGAARLPKYSYHFMVRVWGSNFATRGLLTTVALSIIAARIPTPELFQNELIITHDLVGKFVEVQKTVSFGIEKIIAGSILGIPGSSAVAEDWAVPSVLLESDMASGEGALIANFTTRAEGTSPFITINNFNTDMNAPPYSNNSRGWWIGRIVAQGLSGACERPPFPPAAANNVNPP